MMRLRSLLLAFVSLLPAASIAQTQPEVFDVNVYEGIYPDLFNAFGSNTTAAQNHWLNQGLPVEGRRASFIFDPVYYIAHNPGVPTGYTAALQDFLNNGLPAGKRGSLEFDVKYYLARYSDLAALYGTNYLAAADHFINQGLPCDGRQGSADFAVQDYINMYPDVAAGYPKVLSCVNGPTDFKNAALQWLRRGKAFGRHGFGFLNASLECMEGHNIVEFLNVLPSPAPPATPTTGTATVSQASAFTSNASVVYMNPPPGFGPQLTAVASSPARGQYSVAGGVYTFNVADIDQPIQITYNMNPVPAGYSRIFFSHVGGTGLGTLNNPFDASLMDDNLRRISEQNDTSPLFTGQIPVDSNPGETSSGGVYHVDHLIVCLIDTPATQQPFLTRGIWDFVINVGHKDGTSMPYNPDANPASPVPSGFTVNRNWHIHGQGMNATTVKLLNYLNTPASDWQFPANAGLGIAFGTHGDDVGGVEISDLMVDLNYQALKSINPSENLQLMGVNLRGDPGGNNIHNIHVIGYAAQASIEQFPVWIVSDTNVIPTQGAYNQIKYVLLDNSAPGAVDAHGAPKCTGITLANVQGEVAFNVANGWSTYANNFGGCQGYGGWDLENAWFHDNIAFNNSTSFLIDSLTNRSVTIEFNQFTNPQYNGMVLGGGGIYDYFTIQYNTFSLATDHNVGILLQGNVHGANVTHNNVLVTSPPPPNVIAIFFQQFTTGNLGNILQYNQVGEGIGAVPDGNCVFTNWDTFGNPLASPPATQSTPCAAPATATATLQSDGDFVVNGAGTALWSTLTSGSNASIIVVQNDGNFVLYQEIWQAGTYATPSPGPFPAQGCNIGSNALIAGQFIFANQCIVSLSGQYMLYMAPDGNFFIYDIAHNIGTWGPGTYGHPNAFADMQTNGNFVVYDANSNALWASNTYGSGATDLRMESDGRIILYKPWWSSGQHTPVNATPLSPPPSSECSDVGEGTGSTGVIGPGNCFVSPNGIFELVLQANGALVLYDRSANPRKPVWHNHN